MSSEPTNETIRDRFEGVVTASGRTVVDIEAAAGLKRDRLRDFLARRKAGIGLADAAAIAAELGASLDYLAAFDLRERRED
jgi:hypothetical protein